MSIFASRTQQTIPIPFDVPHTVTIQKLAGRQVEKAREANQFASADRLKGMGGAAFQRELGALGDPAATAALVAKAQADPLNTYDRATVLQKGIKAWTYDDAVTPEAIDDLSEEAADFLARAILDLTLPRRDAAEKKNRVRGLVVGLNGDGPLTFEYWLGRLSEEFGGRLPSEVLAEVDRLPAGLLEQIIEDRYIARAIATYKQNPTAEGDLADLVKAVHFELVQEEIDAEHVHD